MREKLTLVGTMITMFPKNKNHALHDIKFCCQKEIALVSYVPKLSNNSPNVLKPSGRCYVCPRTADKKSRNHCALCMRFV